MFQSNAAKEVLYIFLWLIGIIFVYALVHTYLLEPTKSHHANAQPIHATSNTSTSHQVKLPKDKVSSKINTDKILTMPKVVAPVSVVKVPVTAKMIQPVPKIQKYSKKEALLNTHNKKVSERNNASSLPIKIPTVEKTVTIAKTTQSKYISTIPHITAIVKVPSIIATPTVVTVPSVPSTPSLPTVPSIPSVKKISIPNTAVKLETEIIERKTMRDTEITRDKSMRRLSTEISRDEQMKLLDTARKHVIEQAEASRKKAMSALNQ